MEIQQTESKFVYLSDVSYDQNRSVAGAGEGIHLDENQDNQMITLKVNGASTPSIKKGVPALGNIRNGL